MSSITSHQPTPNMTWIKQQPLPNHVDSFSNITKVSDNEFIVSPYNYGKFGRISNYEFGYGFQNLQHKLLLYNCTTNKWKEIIDYPENIKLWYHTIVMDNKSKQLYIHGLDQNCIIKFDFINKTFKTFVVGYDCGTDPSTVIINDEFHTICGYKNNKHFVWDDKQHKLKHIHTFNEYSYGLHLHVSVYIPSKKCILLIGGQSNCVMDTIQSYDITDKKWSTLDIKLPKPICAFGHILTYDEQYIIIFGGYGGSCHTDEIYILDLTRMKFCKSKIKCPTIADTGRHFLTGGRFHAISVRDNKREELIAFGFVKECWKLNEFCDVTYPPYYIIKLMQKYCVVEYVHLLQFGTGKHWKIESSRILINEH